MNLTTEIILWTLSIILALSGITFGIIASYNSSKANKSIKNLISDSWVSENSQKIFFKNLKLTLNKNKKVIKMLSTQITYFDYSLNSSEARYPIIPNKLIKVFKDTEYKDLLELYISNKKTLDVIFKKIITNFAILQTDKKISTSKKKELIKYHKKSISIATNIIKTYSQISSIEKDVK